MPSRLPSQRQPLPRARSLLGCAGTISFVLAFHTTGGWLIHLLGTCVRLLSACSKLKPCLTESCTPKTSNSCKIKWATARRMLKFAFTLERICFLLKNVFSYPHFYLPLQEIKNCLEQEDHLGNAEECEMIFYNSLWSQAITGSKGRLCLEHKYSCTLEISQIEKENSKSLKIKSMPHAHTHTHTHTHFTYFRNTVSKVMKVILNTFLISVENVPNSTRALVSITTPRPWARERIQFFKN